MPLQPSAFSSILLLVSRELTIGFERDAVSRTVLNKDGPDGRPQEHIGRRENEFDEQARFGEGTCKAELADGNIGQITSLEHSDADQAKGNHVHEEFLVEGGGCLTMPRSGTQGVFKIAIEGFDIPAHVIEAGQF